MFVFRHGAQKCHSLRLSWLNAYRQRLCWYQSMDELLMRGLLSQGKQITSYLACQLYLWYLICRLISLVRVIGQTFYTDPYLSDTFGVRSELNITQTQKLHYETYWAAYRNSISRVHSHIIQLYTVKYNK